MSDTRVDVDDVAGCPLGSACESCGGAADLTVETAQVPVGVYCATLCPECVEAQRIPSPASWREACGLVLTHCEHLGIDMDEMADAIRPADNEATN